MRTTSTLALLAAAGFAVTCATPALAADAKKKCDDLACKWENGDPLTFAGITIYGTVDAGVDSVTHGAGYSAYAPPNQNYVINKNSNGSWTGAVGSPMEQSKLGLKGTESLGGDVSFVFKVETGFNPVSGVLTDGVKSVALANGLPLAAQNAIADSSRAGQIYEGAAWAGLSSKSLGTLTYGWQNAILADTITSADPNGNAYAFGLIGFTGTWGGGGGDTENARLGDSLRYANTINGVRVGAQYQFAEQYNGGQAFQFGLGADPVKGLSIDGAYANKTGGISAGSLTAAQVTAAGLLGLSSDHTINETLSDNQALAITAKYDGGMYKLSGGYEYVTQGNSSDPLGLATSANGSLHGIGDYNVFAVTNNKYDTNRVTQMLWFGGKYNFTKQFSGSAGYYHLWQNDYTTGAGAGKDCASATAAAPAAGPAGNCAGAEDVVSGVLDYQATKHIDVYAGAMYSKVGDGLANGFLNTDNTSVAGGVRLKF